VPYTVAMARLARVVAPGYPHHVTQRGVPSLAILREDEDWVRLLEKLKDCHDPLRTLIYSYVLMDDLFTFDSPKDEMENARQVDAGFSGHAERVAEFFFILDL